MLYRVLATYLKFYYRNTIKLMCKFIQHHIELEIFLDEE